MMVQYSNLKAQYPDCVLLFRLGDFYETFDDDARYVSKVLGLVLTHRSDHPMAGIPYHALNLYLKKLIENGNKVAICDQLEDPALAKGIVKRDVTRIVTPGTIIEDDVLPTENNYIAAYYKGVTALIDISTGDFFVDTSEEAMEKYNPKHVIHQGEVKEVKDAFVERVEDWYFDPKNADSVIKAQFGVEDISFLELTKEERTAAAAILKYLQITQKRVLANLKRPVKLRRKERIFLDVLTISNLEIIKSNGLSLYSHMNRTVTNMGQRTLRREIVAPLADADQINKRLDLVEFLTVHHDMLESLRNILSGIHDVERIISRMTYGAATPSDAVALRESIGAFHSLNKWIRANSIFSDYLLDPVEDLYLLLKSAIAEEPQGDVGSGKVIANGFSKALDEARSILYDIDGYIKSYEEREKSRIGNKVKIGYSSVFGYYIEISKAYKGEIPPEYVRKQTLVNAERYTTPELVQLEKRVLQANENVTSLEIECFERVRNEVVKNKDKILENATKIAFIDMISSFAWMAIQENYVRPSFGSSVKIEGGRHPIVEKRVSEFIANDLEMDEKKNFVVLTGPNMSGKSTFIRQVALIAIMAQMGAFVPAKSAQLRIFDRIFTRIGARDDLTSNKSTFLVEMSEVSTILNFATKNSFIILDEIGRGTSTFDGLSIAWAVSEYISQKVGAFTIFATHYNELSELEKIYPNIYNLTIEVLEKEKSVLFLHKVVHGTADKSYGIEVAKIAGIPNEVIQRAYEVSQAISSVSHIEKGVRFLTSGEVESIKKKIKSVNKDQINFFENTGGLKWKE